MQVVCGGGAFTLLVVVIVWASGGCRGGIKGLCQELLKVRGFEPEEQSEQHGNSELAEEERELAVLCRESSVAPGKVLERKADYGDRLQLRQDISEWALNAASREPGCLVLGGPGVGKTALLVGGP
eukprot:COSAG01_NODE_15051_length_1379_cov_3.289844_3_plen_126_part_00